MRLKVAFDQAEALRRGIETTDSTILLEVAVEPRPQPIRDFIADRFWAGGILESPYDVGNSQAALLEIIQPDEQGLIEKIESELANTKQEGWTAVVANRRRHR